jgi:hypothetical protein
MVKPLLWSRFNLLPSLESGSDSIALSWTRRSVDNRRNGQNSKSPLQQFHGVSSYADCSIHFDLDHLKHRFGQMADLGAPLLSGRFCLLLSKSCQSPLGTKSDTGSPKSNVRCWRKADRNLGDVLCRKGAAPQCAGPFLFRFQCARPVPVHPQCRRRDT